MNVQQFLSNISAVGLSRSNRFRIIFTPPGNLNRDVISLASLFVESAEIPGRTMQTTDFRIYGPSFKNPVLSTYNDINFNLLCDRDLSQKQIFDSWLDLINPINTFDFNYREEYTSSVKIQQIADDGSISYSCELIEAFPTAVGALATNWADDNFHRVQITMSYRFWQFVPVTGAEATPGFVT